MKKFVASLLIIILLGAGFLTYRYLPVFIACNNIAKSDVVEFETKYDLEDSLDLEDFPDSFKKGTVIGEYENGAIHASIFPEGSDVAVIEFYRDADENLVFNLKPTLDWCIAYADEKTGFSISSLIAFFTETKDTYITDAQIQTITGYNLKDLLASEDTDETDDSLDLVQIISFINKLKVEKGDQGTTVSIDIAKSDDIPISVSASVRAGEAHEGDMEIPVSTISDSDIEMYKTIFDYIVGIVTANS